MDRPNHGRVNRRAGGQEEVNRQMDGAPFRQLVGFLLKGIGGIEQTRFIVAPHADLDAGLSHLGKEPFGKGGGVGWIVQIRNQGATDAQVKDQNRLGA